MILGSTALLISVLSYCRHYGTFSDMFNYVFSIKNNDEENRNIPWHSKEDYITLPYFDIPKDLRNEKTSIKALLVDNDAYEMTTDIDYKSKFCRSKDLFLLANNNNTNNSNNSNNNINDNEHNEKQLIVSALLTGGCLTNLNELYFQIQHNKIFKHLKVIDLSDNLLRSNDLFGKLDINLLALKNLLLHLNISKGVLILVGNDITTKPYLFESIIEHYPSAFLRLIWISKRDLESSTLLDKLKCCLSRVKLSYLHKIIQAHTLFYDEISKLDEIHREEFAYIL
jgi:hypothetical protein